MSEINHINLHVEVNDLTQHVAMKHPDSAATRDLNIDKDLTSVVISNTSECHPKLSLHVSCGIMVKTLTNLGRDPGSTPGRVKYMAWQGAGL